MMNMKIAALALLGLIDSTVAETCSICAGGFDASLSDFAMPAATGPIAGTTCAQIEAIIGNFQVGSDECNGFSLVQGFCCPKCFMCGTPENDLAMTKPDSVVQPETGLTCKEMAYTYGFLSYSSSNASNGCPEDIETLDTTHIPGAPKDGPGLVSPGIELRGICGCPGFEDSKPDPPLCDFCPTGKEAVTKKNDLIDIADTTVTCTDVKEVVDYVTADQTCARYADFQGACCMDVDAEQPANDGESVVADIEVDEEQPAIEDESGARFSKAAPALTLAAGIIGAIKLF